MSILKKKLCIIVSSSMTIKAFMINHLRVLSKEFNITVICDEYIDFQKNYNLNITFKQIFINRKIDIISDIKSLFTIFVFLRKNKFDIVLTVTPKAGFVGMVSSYFALVNTRIHFFTGQVWATKKGFFRFLLKTIDKITSFTSTSILVDSPSQREFIIGENIVSEQKSHFLHKGSISGVDLNKFKKDQKLRESLRKEYNIANELVFVFLGRLNIDKGILDLATVFNELLDKYNDVKLLLIGPTEGDIEDKISYLINKKNLIRIGYVSNPQEILNMADILVLPSYREGFGTIVIEAAAMNIPTIGSNIYGLNDAIIDNNTGLLHNKKDLENMKNKYEQIILNRDLIKTFGENAYNRVVDDFSSDILSNSLLNFLTKNKG